MSAKVRPATAPHATKSVGRARVLSYTAPLHHDASIPSAAGRRRSGDWRASLRSQRTRALRRAVPHGRRGQLRAQISRATWRLYAGSSVSCNCCGGKFRRFRVYVSDGGHRSLTCPRCNALGRHRVDWLYLTDHTDMLRRPTRLLHIAPEVCLEAPLRGMAHVDYLSADYDSTLAMEKLDVRSIHHGDESFDAVICNHVLQLVDDDRAAMSELCRILRPRRLGADPELGRRAARGHDREVRRLTGPIPAPDATKRSSSGSTVGRLSPAARAGGLHGDHLGLRQQAAARGPATASGSIWTRSSTSAASPDPPASGARSAPMGAGVREADFAAPRGETAPSRPAPAGGARADSK